MATAGLRRRLRTAALALWMCVTGAPLLAQNSSADAPAVVRETTPQVWLVTVEPGEVYWQRFGHNTLLIQPAAGPSISYNFGYFDFEQQDFLLRFLRGRMLYQAVALDGRSDIESYVRDQRRVWMQRLRLSERQTERLIDHLETHVRPENREYRYDYFSNNCSSKLRDALDHALDGGLRRATDHRSHGFSHRYFARAYAQSLPWLYLGIDLGLGQDVDRPLSIWEEGFIPGELKRQMREMRDEAGLPMVIEERLLPAGAESAEVWPQPPDWRPLFAAAGLLLASVLLTLARLGQQHGGSRTSSRVLGGVFAFVIGVTGLVVFGLMTATDHSAAASNENLLLFSPLWLLSLPAWWLARPRASLRFARAAAWIALACALFAVFSKVMRGFDQSNIEWLLLMVPITIALLLSLPRSSALRMDKVAS